MANQNILSIDRGNAKATEKYLSDLIKQINVLNDRVNSVSLTNVIDSKQVELMKKNLTGVVKQVELIVTKHQEGVAQVTKQSAKGMSDAMAGAVDTKALKDARDLLGKLKSDVASVTKSTGAGAANDEVTKLVESIDTLSTQMESYQASTNDLAKSLGNVNNIYAEMNANSGQLVDNYSDMASYADDMSFATRSTSKDYGRLATQAERADGSFQSSAQAMNSFVGDIQVANNTWSDVSDSALDVKSTVEGTDFSGFKDPLGGDPFEGLNEAANTIGDLVDSGSALGDSFGGASDQIDSASSSSREMQKIFELIAASVSPLPEMLKAMKTMVGQASSYARQTGMAALSTDQMADTWQNTVLNAVAVRDATIETAGAVKRIYGPEIAGSVAKLEASTQFIDAYWDNIYQNAKLAEGVNKSMGYEAVKASAGSAAIMGHIQFTKHLMLEQTGMLGRARVLQTMAKESIGNNLNQINEIENQYNALDKKISGADKTREWLSMTEKEKLKSQQEQLMAQKQQLELENKRKAADGELLGIFNKITGAIQGAGAALGIGVDANEKRLDLAERTEWVEKATAEKAWDVKAAADGLSESVGAVELKSKRVDEYWGGIQASFKGGTGVMQSLLEGGLAGSIKQVTLIKTAQNLMKQQDTMANRIRTQRYVREERARGAENELSKLEREWRGMDQAITDHNKGYITLTNAELRNLKFRQKTVDAQRKALKNEVSDGKKSGLLEKGALAISDAIGNATDFFTRTDKYSEKTRNLRKQLLTMEEQSSRLSKETSKNNRSLAQAIAGSYKQQRTAIADTGQQSATAQDAYKSIESTSAKILEYWQKMFDMFTKMNGMSADGGISLGGSTKEVKSQADGIEALAEQIDNAQDKFKNLFNQGLLQKWGANLNKEFGSIEDVIADPEAFQKYEEDILDMLTRSVQNITGINAEAAKNMAKQMIPALKEVQDVAAGNGSIKGKGYFFDDMDNQLTKKTKTINRLMKTQAETGFQAFLKNGIMNPDQMADAIFRNADRLSEMFSEDFFESLKQTLPGHEKDGAKTLSDFMSDPKLWGDSRHNIVSTLAQQFAALNGESAEFNYALAHELLPTLDEVKASLATGKPIKMDLKIEDIKVENAEKLHEQLVNKIMKTGETPGENALLMSNKGLEGREYSLDQIKSYKSTGLRAAKDKFDAKRGKQDFTALKSEMSFLSGELNKITEEYNKQIKEKAGDSVLAPLLAQEAAVKASIARNREEMEAAVNSVEKVDTSSMTALQRIAYGTKSAFGDVASGMLGVAATIQEGFSVGDAVKNVTALGREANQLAELQAGYAAAEKASGDVLGSRYQALIDARKSLDEATDSVGNVDSGNFELFLNKIRAIPQESAQVLQSVGENAYQQLTLVNAAMQETTDPAKIAMLREIADQQQQNIDDYKQMIQNKTGFDSGTASKWQNRVGQISQAIQQPSSVKSGLMQTNFSDVLGNNFDEIQGKMLEFGGKMKGLGGIFKFLGEHLGSIMAVLQGVNIGFDLFDRIMGKSPEQIAKYSAAIDKLGEDISNMISTAANATSSTGQDQLNQLRYQQIQAQITAKITSDAAVKMTGMGDTIKTVAEKALVGTTTLYGEMGTKAMEASKSLAEINKQLEQAENNKKYYDMLAGINRVIDRAQQAFQDLMDIEGQKVQAEFEFNKEKRADQAEFDRQFKRDSEQKAIDLLYSQEDWARQRVDAYKDNMQAILDVEKDYTKSIRDADKDMNEARKESFKQLVKEDTQGDIDYNKSKQEAETAFQDQSYETEKDYIKGMLQTQKDYAKERIRQERDLIDQLRDLEMQNDVLGYIQAQRDAEKQMKDQDDDHNEQLADTRKQHEQERAENLKAHELEMADLEEQNADRKLQLTVGYLEEQQQRQEEHDKQLAQMKIDAQERLDEQVKSYGKAEAEAWNQFVIDEEREKARTALSKRYADEDRAMQLASNQRSFQDQLVQFQQQEDVAKANLVAYYRSQGMTREEALAEAEKVVNNAHNQALSNLTDHGLNMAKQAQDNNDLMLEKEIELGKIRVQAQEMIMQQMADAMIAISAAQMEKATKAAAAQKEGSFVDDIGKTLSGGLAIFAGGISQLLGGDHNATMASVWTGLRGAATGGDFDRGEVIMVGEKGPELFVPHETGTIIPHELSKQIAEQGGVKAFADGTSNVSNMKFKVGGSDPSGGRGFVPPSGGSSATNTAPVVWTGGKPTAGNNRQGSTSVEVMPDSPALVVSDMHYKPGVDSIGGGGGSSDGTDWESELNKLGPGRDKLADTKKRIDEIQTKFQANWLKIASTNTDFQSKVGAFDKDRLSDLYKNTFETYTKDLQTRREFADKMVMEGKATNKDAWQNQTTFNKDTMAEQQAAQAKQLENYKGLFTGMITTLTGGKADSIAIIDGLTQGATDLLTLFNVDGTGTIKSFVDNAGGFLKNLFGASDKSDEAGKKTESGMGSIFNTISSFVSDIPGTTKNLMSAGLAVLQGKAPDFETAFKMTHDAAGKGIQLSDQELMQNRKQAALDTASTVYTVEQGQLAATTKNVFDISDITGKANDERFIGIKANLEATNKVTKASTDQQVTTVKNATNTIVDTTSKGFSSVQSGASTTGGSLTSLQSVMATFTGNISSMVATYISLSKQVVSAKNSLGSSSGSKGSSGSSSGSHSKTGGGGVRPSDLEGYGDVFGGGRAGGGGVDSSHGYLVGERGPEWFQPDKVGKIATSRDLTNLMRIIPKAYDAMMTDIRTPKPDYSSHSGTNMSLRIDSLTIGSDMSRAEIEQQFKRMGVTIVRTLSTAVG